MEYDLNERQEMLSKTARDFLIAECPKALVKEMAKDEKGYTSELWHKMSDIGWMGLVFPEKYGGSGGSFVDLIVLLEEMGYACLPGPFFSTVLLGGMAILKMGNDYQKQEFLSKIAEGNLIVTMALAEPGGGYDVDKVTVKAIFDGSSYIISGTKLFVPDAHISDLIISSALTDKGSGLFLIDAKSPNVKYTLLNTIAEDKQFEVVFDKVNVHRRNKLGSMGKELTGLKEVLHKAIIAKCAEMVGGARQVIEMTTEYVKERKQFGVAVGSFQAVQHHCANMLTYYKTARFMTYQAASMLSEGRPCEKEVSMAKAWVSDSYQKITILGHQCIGGVAFMEDHDMPLFSKRAVSAGSILGDADFHREQVAKAIGL